MMNKLSAYILDGGILMGTLVCKDCGEIIAPIDSEKSEIIFGICKDCSCH